MFGKKKIKAAQIDTLIGKNTVVKGDIHYRGGLHIEGKVQGDLIAESNEKTVLIVSEKGRVEGDVKGPVVILNGTIEGDVYSTATLEMAQHAKVKGNVYYKLLEMEVGAEVNGSLIHQSVQSVKANANQSSDKKAKSDSADVGSGADEVNLTAGNS
ncbi:MAG: polymer-forming cytoskeletal protein [Gammaproteobacteria bacterium]